MPGNPYFLYMFFTVWSQSEYNFLTVSYLPNQCKKRQSLLITDVDAQDVAGTAGVDVQDETGTANGNNSASNDNGLNGGTPSLGISIDLSSLFRPPTRQANPPLPSTITLVGDPFTQPVGP